MVLVWSEDDIQDQVLEEGPKPVEGLVQKDHILNSTYQGTIGYTPNSVPMVFIVLFVGILGDHKP